MKILLILIALTLFGADCLAEQAAKDEEHKLFSQLKTLVGTWEAKEKDHDGGAMRTSYRMTAGGTAIEETFNKGTPGEMISVYHPDGSAVVMTHYCMIGNQPRMKAQKSDDGEIFFRFQDITNHSEGAPHMKELKMTLVDEKQMRHAWTFIEDGKEVIKTFNFVRQ